MTTMESDDAPLWFEDRTERLDKSVHPAEMEEKTKELFRLVHHGKWKEVVSLYEKYPELQDKSLTATNETTLHVAILAGNKEAVTMLLNVLNNTDSNQAKEEFDSLSAKYVLRRILTVKNDDGVTPIHLATLDMDGACMDMARLCPDLVTEVRNKDGETLLFKAVREGKKELFFALELLLQETQETWPLDMVERDVTHCRRNDGNNILHIAIYGEYFDLAYEIVYLYPSLINYVNKRGESPLHYLANKPSSFRSRTSFNLFDQVTYSCIFIEPIETKFDKYKRYHERHKRAHASDDRNLPEACNTISQIFTFMKLIFGYASIILKQIRGKHAKNDEENPGGCHQESSEENKKRLRFHEIYELGDALFKIMMKILLVILGIGWWRTRKLERMKQKHNAAYQLMNELIQCSEAWEYDKMNGMDPHIWRPSSFPHASPSKETEAENSIDSVSLPKEPPPDDSSSSNGDISEPKKEEINKPDEVTPVLVAAKNGITEIVEKILDTFPVALLDMDKDAKNIMLLAVEYRQIHMYEFLSKRKIMNDSVFRKVDKNGNSALHLAAKRSPQKLPWDLGGAALRMQWDVKWYKYVMNTRKTQFFATWNSDGETAQEIFSKEHKDLVKDAGKWMQKTSQSFSVVATLIASVAFASATTVPGSTNQDSGLPILSGVFSFKVFTVFALVAFCFSVASLLMFLNIITSPYRDEDFERSLPGKLLIGLTSLLTAIVAMLVAFCAGNFLAMEKELQSVAFAIYAITSFLVLIFALGQFPLYAYLLEATVYTLPPKSAEIMDTF